jgi:hypothetical protein
MEDSVSSDKTSGRVIFSTSHCIDEVGSSKVSASSFEIAEEVSDEQQNACSPRACSILARIRSSGSV